MASFQKVYYCKNCKSNVTVNEKVHCKKCGGTNFNVTWSVRFRHIDSTGKEVQKRLSGFLTKKEAQESMLEFSFNNNKMYKKVKNLMFQELYNEYEQFIKSRTKPSTYYNFISQCQKILPFFKDFEVNKITAKDILNWQNTISDLSYNYKAHIRTYLSSLLSYAEKYYDIPNQLPKVDKFRRTEPKKEMQIWTPEQFNSAMKHINKFEYKAYYTALYLTGARKGEILATYWEDWDLKNKSVNINKSITNKIKDTKYIITTPKNESSVRKIKIPDSLVVIMQQLFDQQKETNKLGMFAFGGQDPLPTTCICRYLTNAAKAAELPFIRIHDLRHSHASYLISQGVSVVSVAKRLGHSSIEQTLNTYAHMMPKEEDLLIKKLNKVI